MILREKERITIDNTQILLAMDKYERANPELFDIFIKEYKEFTSNLDKLP